MPRIEANQYIQFEAYLRTLPKRTRTQEAQVFLLKGLDEQCRRCQQFPDSTMLCDGMRLIFQSETPTRLVLSACDKKDCVTDTEQYERRLWRAGIIRERMAAVVDAKLDAFESVVERHGVDLLFDGVRLEPFVFEYQHDVRIELVWSYIVAMASQGFQGIFFNAMEYYKAHLNPTPIQLMDRLQEPMLECDWLVIENLDYPFDISRVRDGLFMTVKARISAKKPTMLILAKGNRFWDSVDEKQFFEEIVKWPRLNLK